MSLNLDAVILPCRGFWSCLGLSYSLIVDYFNLFTSNKQRPCKDFCKVSNIRFWSQLSISDSVKFRIVGTFITGLVTVFLLPVISSTKHDFGTTFDIFSSNSWRTIFLSFNFAAWLFDMAGNVWHSNFLLILSELSVSKDFLLYVSVLKRKFLTGPGVIVLFLLGIFQNARILVHVGCVTPIKTAA